MQMNIFTITPAPMTYCSGNIRSINETRALVELDLPIGITVNSDKGTKALAAKYAARGGQVFVDNGAFSEFAKGTNLHWEESENYWEEVTWKFLRFLGEVHQAANGNRAAWNNVIFVMYDHIGDRDNTEENTREYLTALMMFKNLGVKIMVNLQKANEEKSIPGSLADTYRRMSHNILSAWEPEWDLGETLDDMLVTQDDCKELHDYITWGIPSKARCWTTNDITELVQEQISTGAVKIHLLGKGNPTDLKQLTRQLHSINPELIVTGDAVATRSMIGQGAPLTELPPVYVKIWERKINATLTRAQRGQVRKMIFKNLVWTRFELAKEAA